MKSEFDITYILKNIKPPFKGGEVELNRTYVNSFYYIESIENMFMTGHFEFEDRGGFFESLPLTGEESLEVTIIQDIEGEKGKSIRVSKKIEFDFYIVELKEMEKIRTVNYVFKLVEKGFFDFVKRSYSKSFRQKKISEIVTDICKHQLNLTSEKYEVEETKDNINYIIPYWKPLVTIKHLTRLAKRQTAPQESGYLFFSTSGNENETKPIKKFISFATLLEEKADSNEGNKYLFKKNDGNPDYINNFLEVRNPYYKNNAGLKNGISGKKFFGVDFVTDKALLTVQKTYTEYVSDARTLGKKAFFPSDIDDVNGEVAFFGHNSIGQIEAHQDHKFRMTLESFNKREAILNGSLERYSGKLIYVEQISDNKGELHDIENSGEWLIKTITHNFMMDVFEQKIVILKSAYSDTVVEGRLDV